MDSYGFLRFPTFFFFFFSYRTVNIIKIFLTYTAYAYINILTISQLPLKCFTKKICTRVFFIAFIIWTRTSSHSHKFVADLGLFLTIFFIVYYFDFLFGLTNNNVKKENLINFYLFNFYFKLQTVQIFIPVNISLCKVKINLAFLLRLKNPENQYSSQKKYGVYLVLADLLTLCLQYSSWILF